MVNHMLVTTHEPFIREFNSRTYYESNLVRKLNHELVHNLTHKSSLVCELTHEAAHGTQENMHNVYGNMYACTYIRMLFTSTFIHILTSDLR